MFDIERLYLNNMAIYPIRKTPRLFGSFQEILQVTFKIQKTTGLFMVIPMLWTVKCELKMF